MDYTKIGQAIRRLRTDKGLTQAALASMLNVSDKAVSKWERGRGCPEVSLLRELSRILEVNVEKLLSGESDHGIRRAVNLAKTLFFVCPVCGNIITAANEAAITCCGKKLSPLVAQKASDAERLAVEIIEDERYITSDHPMIREHSIAFVALLSGDGLILRKTYPEWDLQMRFPQSPHGKLLWYCTRHGLFYQLV